MKEQTLTRQQHIKNIFKKGTMILFLVVITPNIAQALNISLRDEQGVKYNLMDYFNNGGAGGVLNDLDDVTITTPANNEVLTYEDGSWVNKAGGGGGVVDNDFVKNTADTFVSYPVIRQVITLTQAEYDGIETKNANTQYIILEGS